MTFFMKISQTFPTMQLEDTSFFDVLRHYVALYKCIIIIIIIIILSRTPAAWNSLPAAVQDFIIIMFLQPSQN